MFRGIEPGGSRILWAGRLFAVMRLAEGLLVISSPRYRHRLSPYEGRLRPARDRPNCAGRAGTSYDIRIEPASILCKKRVPLPL